MTEKEAKGKSCPIMHWFDEREGKVKDVITIKRTTVDCLCIASSCMMWQWDGQQKMEGAYSVEMPDGEGWIRGNRKNLWKRLMPREGYCGLINYAYPSSATKQGLAVFASKKKR